MRKLPLSLGLTLLLPSLGLADLANDCVSPAIAIPDGFASGVMVDLAPANCREGCVVAAVSVSLEINHPWIGDLVVILEHVDTGTSIALLDRAGSEFIGYPGPYGCGGDDIDVILTEDAALSAHEICSATAVPVLLGDALPIESLSVFEGLSAASSWRLTVADDSIYDQGILLTACVELDWAADCNGNGSPDDVDIANGLSTDMDGNGTPDECEHSPCPADFNGSGHVDIEDFSSFLIAFGSQDADFDLDGSGSVDLGDFSLFLVAFGSSCPSP